MTSDVRIAIPHPSRRAIVLAAIFIWSLAVPTTGWGHARLETARPSNGSELEAWPSELRLTFSADVEAQPDAIQLFGPNNATVTPSLTASQGRTIVATIDKGLPDGSWAYSYRLTSVDGHAISGSASFTVGEASASTDAADRSKSEASTPSSVVASFGVARGLLFLGVLMLVGGGIFALVIAPGWRPRLLMTATVITALAAGSAFVIDAMWQLGIELGTALTEVSLRAEAGTPFGRAMMVLLGALSFTVVPTVALRSYRLHAVQARWLLVPIYVALAMSLALSGHAIESGPITLRAGFDAAHIVAAALWIGSLIQLLFMARELDIDVAAVTRFSHVAVGSVVVLIATGIYAVHAEAALSLSALLDSRYGHLIIAKIMLLLAIMPLAILNKTTLVPALQDHSGEASRLLRSYVLRELTLVSAVLAATAWLVLTPPPA